MPARPSLAALAALALARGLARAAAPCVALHTQHKNAGTTVAAAITNTPTVASNLSAAAWRARGRWHCDYRQWNATSRACEYALWSPRWRDDPGWAKHNTRDHSRPPMFLGGGFALGAAELPAFGRARCVWLPCSASR